MKRFYLLAWVLVLSMPVMAKNKINMVTYFPVPYVAYSETNATAMDIGLTNTCDMKLGCAQSNVTLKATNAVNLTDGRLNLDGGLGVKGKSVVLGEGNKLGKIAFKNARLQTGNMNSVTVEDDTVTNTLNLFGQKFPSCKAKDSTGKMSWKQLNLVGSDKGELYLVCGEGAESFDPDPEEPSTCPPTHYGQESYTASSADVCPPGQTGDITYTWDYASCKYNETITCKACTWKYKRGNENSIHCPDGDDVEKYKSWAKGEMTHVEYLRLVCSSVVPNLGGEQVWIPSYNGTYRHCEQVDNPPVPTSEKDICIMESGYCNSTPDRAPGCPYRSVSLFRAVCE